MGTAFNCTVGISALTMLAFPGRSLVRYVQCVSPSETHPFKQQVVCKNVLCDALSNILTISGEISQTHELELEGREPGEA